MSVTFTSAAELRVLSATVLVSEGEASFLSVFVSIKCLKSFIKRLKSTFSPFRVIINSK